MKKDLGGGESPERKKVASEIFLLVSWESELVGLGVPNWELIFHVL